MFIFQVNYLLRQWKAMQLEQDMIPEVLIKCLQDNKVENECNELIAKLLQSYSAFDKGMLC